MRRALLIAALALLPSVLRAQDSMLVRLYEQATAAAEAGRLAEAVQVMETVAARAPDIANVHWNLGLWHAELEQPDRALAAWQAYRRLAPDDWHARAKLIQAYQALGDTLRRNEERAALIALRQSGADSVLARVESYCREQFRVGGRKVMAFEVFEPAGERRVFYLFHVLKPDGEPLGRYSLGSYDHTTLISRELGEIGKDERMYHLDWYEDRAHATYGFYRALPPYEQVRADVVAALEGRATPVSSTWRQ